MLLLCKQGQPPPERRIGHGDIVCFGGGPNGYGPTPIYYEPRSTGSTAECAMGLRPSGL